MKKSITEVVKHEIQMCDDLVTFVGRKLDTIKFALFLIKWDFDKYEILFINDQQHNISFNQDKN